MDVVGLCNDYSEYESLEEFQGDRRDKYNSIQDIEDVYTVIHIPNDGGFIIWNWKTIASLIKNN